MAIHRPGQKQQKHTTPGRVPSTRVGPFWLPDKPLTPWPQLFSKYSPGQSYPSSDHSESVRQRCDAHMMAIRFILIARDSIRADDGAALSLLRSAHELWASGVHDLDLIVSDSSEPTFRLIEAAGGAEHRVRIVHSMIPEGPKLVRVTAAAWSALRLPTSPVRLVPEEYVGIASVYHGKKPLPAVKWCTTFTVQVRSASTNEPIQGARVELFTDFDRSVGDSATTDINGKAILRAPQAPFRIERMYVHPPRSGYWGSFTRDEDTEDVKVVELTPATPSDLDSVRLMFHTGGTVHCASGRGRGIKVGVVDTGIDGSVVDIAGGCNTVAEEDTEEDDDQHGDNGTSGHGTHVASLIAGHDESRCFARGAEIYSYRVFGQGKDKASTYSILNAAIKAVDAGCDIINFSIELLSRCPRCEAATGSRDIMEMMATDIARHGTIAVAAAGNTRDADRPFVCNCPYIIAVAAIGQIGMFPPGSLDYALVSSIRGNNKDDFLAEFSNYSKIGLLAPGVGIVSRLPGNKCGPWSGTSMACAVASGCIARLLTGIPELKMDRTLARWEKLCDIVRSHAQPLGFPKEYEGLGMLPALVR